jgi:hypothetical protein
VHDTHPKGLPNDLIDEGLKPLKRLLELHPNVRAIVAHGGDAHRSVEQFTSTKRFGAYAEARGLKTWNTRHTSNRAFILREPEKLIAFERVCEAYRDAMRYAELTPFGVSGVALSGSMTGPELRAATRAELLPHDTGTTEA